MEWDIEELLSKEDVVRRSEGSRTKIKNVSSINQATENDLSFCYYDGEKAASAIWKSNVLLCKNSLEGVVHPKPGRQQFFFMDNPRLVFVCLMAQMCMKMSGISRHGTVSESAKIGSGAYIGDYSVVGDNCIVGDSL